MTEQTHTVKTGEKPNTAMPQDQELLPAVVNVISNDPCTGLLSNFGDTPFEIDGRRFASAEGFIHFIKIPPGSAGRQFRELKSELSQLSGARARKRAREINYYLRPAIEVMLLQQKEATPLKESSKVYVHWNQQKFLYGSDQHHQLIARALRAKFGQNPEARSQLLATQDCMLVHQIGKSDGRFTSLPADVFCNILMDIRKELQDKTNANQF